MNRAYKTLKIGVAALIILAACQGVTHAMDTTGSRQVGRTGRNDPSKRTAGILVKGSPAGAQRMEQATALPQTTATAYQILGVAPDATSNEIANAYDRKKNELRILGSAKSLTSAKKQQIEQAKADVEKAYNAVRNPSRVASEAVAPVVDMPISTIVRPQASRLKKIPAITAGAARIVGQKIKGKITKPQAQDKKFDNAPFDTTNIDARIVEKN